MSAEHVDDRLVLRYWCLCLLAALESGGLAPIRKEGLHGLFFLTNAMAPSYEDKSLVELVMYYPRGPYFPELDGHLSRLSAQNFIKVTDLKFFRDKIGSWVAANYRISQRGASCVAELADIPIWERRLAYLSDVAYGMARISDDRVDTAIRADDTYGRPGAADRDVYRFAGREANYTIRRLSKLAAEVPRGLRHSRQDLVRTYATLLDLRTA
jgi:hypothetical protein